MANFEQMRNKYFSDNNPNSNKVAKLAAELIDKYWVETITTEQAKELVAWLMTDEKTRIKIKLKDKYTGVFKNVMGKKRLSAFEDLYNGTI